MSFTAVGPNPAGFQHNNDAAFTASWQNVGDLVTLIMTTHQGTPNQDVACTGVSSSKATWTQVVADYHGSNSAQSSWHGSAYTGHVNSTGSDTLTFTWAGGTQPSWLNAVAMEYTVTSGTWFLDASAHLDSNGSSTWPTLTASRSGELYFGFAWDSSGNDWPGNSGGWIGNSNVDGQANTMAYNPSVGPGSVTPPTFSAATQCDGIVILIAEGSTGPAADLAVRQQNPLLAWPYQQRWW